MKPSRINTTLRSLVVLALFAFATSATAQENLEHAFYKFINSKQVSVIKSFSEERDITKPKRPLVSRAYVYNFTLKAKHEKLIKEVLEAFERDRNNENVYQALNHTGGHGVPKNARDLLVGEDRKNAVSIGMDEMQSWQLLCLLDPTDDTHTHRYAYAIEWNNDPKQRQLSGKIHGKLVVTYSRIPQEVLDAYRPAETVSYRDKMSDSEDLAGEVALLTLTGRLNELTTIPQLVMAFESLKTEFLKGNAIDPQTGGTTAISVYALCSHIAQLMKDFPHLDDPALRQTLQDEIDFMIGRCDTDSDLGRTHATYLKLAKKALK